MPPFRALRTVPEEAAIQLLDRAADTFFDQLLDSWSAALVGAQSSDDRLRLNTALALQNPTAAVDAIDWRGLERELLRTTGSNAFLGSLGRLALEGAAVGRRLVPGRARSRLPEPLTDAEFR